MRGHRWASSAAATEVWVVILALLLSALALAYFYAADHHFFSTRFMSGIFRYLLKTNDVNTAWLTLGICISAACWKNPAPVTVIVDLISANSKVVTIASVILLSLGTIFIYHDTAFSMDEYAECFQAKVFATGNLSARLPPSVVDWLVPPGFNGGFLIASHVTGQAIEVFWPGFALILAPFEFLGAPWLCNPCLSGIAMLLIYRITLDISGDKRAAGWALVFTLASGAFVAYGISYYSMQARLTTNLVFVWLLLKPTPGRTFGAGVVGSAALVVHSPFPHVLFAAPWIIALLRSKEHRRFMLPLMIGYLPLLVIMGAGWLHLRGAITAGKSDFEPISSNLNTVFSLPDASMFDMRAAALVKMWIWAVPGLFLLAILGRFRCGADYRIRLLMQSAALTFAGYMFVIFDQGHGWGYRYFHSAWGVTPILAACAMTGRPESGGRLAAFAGAAAILNLLVVLPCQMIQIESVIGRHSAQLPAPQTHGRNIYFINDSGGGFYAADLVQVDPLLSFPDLRLYSRGPELDAELRRQNWPSAVLVARGPGIELWHEDIKILNGTGTAADGSGRFAFSYAAGGPAIGSTR